jgi:hypothetical protein
MKITEQTLKDKSACPEGIKAFIEMFPDGFDLSDWTLEKQIEIIKSPLVKYIGWAHYHKVIPLWSMANANLANANLAYANLAYANLANTNLADANLAYANLAYANLANTNLADANLANAYLANANLADAYLAGATYTKYTIWPEGFNITDSGAIFIEV